VHCPDSHSTVLQYYGSEGQISPQIEETRFSGTSSAKRVLPIKFEAVEQYPLSTLVANWVLNTAIVLNKVGLTFVVYGTVRERQNASTDGYLEVGV
jgi:hypothetical protein